ncbi:MAG: hypothetical protein DBX47_00145 [Clostridiales bacterium]|nr:MAG: hypothetical protein DBX47_00145 [Clostridiales bacterium]
MSRRKLILLISSCCAAALLLALVFLLFNNFSKGLTSETVYTLTLSSEELEITDKNVKCVLSATLTPKNDKAVLEYSSSNDSIITFDESGVVTAVKSGVAAAVVQTAIDGKKYEAICMVIVDIGENVSDIEDGGNLEQDPGPPVPAIPEPVIDSDGFLSSDNLMEYNIYNNDAVAWIYVPGTNINLPVAQKTSFTDREFYLDHGFNLYPKFSGSAFLDYRCHIKDKRRVLDQQTVVFGHARGTDIFDQLEKVTLRKSWFENESNRYIYLNTLLESTVWQVYACYYTNFDIAENQIAATTPNFLLPESVVNEKYSSAEIVDATSKGTLFTLQQDANEFRLYAATWRSRMETTDSRYSPFYKTLFTRDYGITDPIETDKIITLITCADANSNVRYVVQAKLIKTRERVPLE